MEQDAQPANVDHLSGETVVRLMRANGQTIRSLASAMDVTQLRVRQARAKGVRGVAYVWDWCEAITGSPRLSWSDIALV